MYPSAMMIKLTEPSGDLYRIAAVSDEDVARANNEFISRDLPFRIRRIPSHKSAL
jgi:hypothetical protein